MGWLTETIRLPHAAALTLEAAIFDSSAVAGDGYQRCFKRVTEATGAVGAAKDALARGDVPEGIGRLIGSN